MSSHLCFLFILLCALLLPPLLGVPAPAVTRQYEVGKTYVYHLKSDVYMNDGSDHINQKTGRQVGYGLEGEVHATSLWRDPNSPLTRIMEFNVKQANLVVTPADKKVTSSNERRKHASKMESVSHEPLYVLFKDNEIVRVWVSSADDTTYLNIKKGIASMLQYQVTSEIKHSQVDVSGKCKVTFKADGKHIRKIKDSCDHPDLEQYEHPNPVRSVKVITSSQTNYQLLADLSAVQSAQSSESVRMQVNAWPDASIEVTAHHNLKMSDTVSSTAKVSTLSAKDESDAIRQLEAAIGGKFKLDTIIARPHQVNHAVKFKGSLKDRIALFREQLSTEKLATLVSPMAFVTLLENFRIATEQEVYEALKDKQNTKIVQQLLDVAGAAQTIDSLKGALKFINLEAEDTTLSERFLLSLSMASHPSPDFINELQALATKPLKNKLTYATLVSALGSVLRHGLANNHKMEAAHRSRIWLEETVGTCKDEECKLIFLRALKNCGHPTSIPTLLKQLKSPSKKVVTLALRALKETGPANFPGEVLDEIEKVYYERHQRHESTAKALAAEMIFASGDQTRIEHVVKYVHNLGCAELQTFVTKKFFELIDIGRSPSAKKVAGNHTVSNYHSLAHGGLSSTFTRLLAKSRDLNTTYAVNMELIPGGLLKETSFDINIQTSPQEEMQLISVNLFASGLSGVAGGDTSGSDSGNGEEETTAGMVLNILGVELRPYVFFRGTGELMGHVWSGTASEHTPALQGNFLLMDHMQLIPLLNGLIIQLQLKGSISADLGGSVQISLWNRNSHSVVHSAGAVLVQGTARLLSDVASARVEVNVGVESFLDFITDFEFYEKPYKMCIQMTNPGLVLKHNVRKFEGIEGKQHLVRTLRKRSVKINGKSYALTQKNSELCTEMLGS